MYKLSPKLEVINETIEGMLSQLENTPAENEQSDNLVLLLQKYIGERQIYINLLITDAIDDSFSTCLSEQLKLTQCFISRSSKVMSHQQSLLSLKQSHQRQIKIYQNIDGI
ncbi:flagella biosynthesis chaperone for FliD, FliT [Shewanella sp. MF05960]|uniref:flagella biosynthesis chaperone for FliD, FliT n=1 Tax=Shewanella sp. MF05960 TaxID=3434874 RepID=UPI003D792A07